jgi:diacylglycerol kinase (ATP)
VNTQSQPHSQAGGALRRGRATLVDSFRFAARGLAYFLRSERNARIHAAIVLAMVLAGLALGLQTWEWAAVLLAAGAVLAAELINTAVEALVDMVSPDWSATAATIKDLTAAAVLVTTMVAVVVGGVVFWPHVVELVRARLEVGLPPM